jgi:Peptidase C13 family
MDSTAPPQMHEPIMRGALGAWWWQGLRSALLLRPAWGGLQATPSIVAWLVLAPLGLSVLIERLYIVGNATFYWPALLAGWLTTVVMAWACWLLVPAPSADAAQRPPTAVALFAMLCAQLLSIFTVWALIFVPLTRNGYLTPAAPARWATWLSGVVGIGWYAAAQLLLLWRSGVPRIATRCLAMLMLAGAVAAQMWVQPIRLWYPSAPIDAEVDTPEPFKLTQELLELQPQLLQSKLKALAGERRGVVDVYAITFAPYAAEGVFQRESDLVATVMRQRFGAAGKTIQLVNHESTIREWPWATPLNLQRAIARAAQLMNRDEDILFIYLTSHGAKDGQLSAEFWPLAIDSVTPAMLRHWLDDAGVRFRVISVSACYSGSWIEPLAGPGTLVMTAADADHTSYGCGSRSPLTFFGRAMFDEQLRHTWSFEQAHAAARTVIEQREREAGKSDGYSNPRIRVGAQIRERLASLEAQQAKAAP